jgi:hypothetical protein
MFGRVCLRVERNIGSFRECLGVVRGEDVDMGIFLKCFSLFNKNKESEKNFNFNFYYVSRDGVCKFFC